ncbi:DUF998 domain-containing protein [Nesterenkonia ebinurensis]|uniref:DUF998 domain-containing protein n=1 Tax=Nesterenkonia ebinurensis TaxID=2608252 RepID=UPI00123E1BA5|nr:DUF998 domain-containing protein [Nesterenkonia ebinurensis]
MATSPTFNTRAAITRSMLGWGIVAGPFYIFVGVVHALLRPEFEFSQHALSLLMLTETGWIQRINLILAGIMVIFAAWGMGRSVEGPARARTLLILIAAYGASLIGGGLFPPDAVEGFLPGAEAAVSTSGILHLAFGGIGFLMLAAAAVVFSSWCQSRESGRGRLLSILAGLVVTLGFVGGATLSTMPAGVLLLWIAVVMGFVWLAGASLYAYRTVPHPDGDRTAKES